MCYVFYSLQNITCFRSINFAYTAETLFAYSSLSSFQNVFSAINLILNLIRFVLLNKEYYIHSFLNVIYFTIVQIEDKMFPTTEQMLNVKKQVTGE